MSDPLIPAKSFNGKEASYELAMIESQALDEILAQGHLSDRTMDRIRDVFSKVIYAGAIESARMSSYEGN